MNLANNTILITGGGSGIGLALAAELLNQKNKIIICGRNYEKLKQAKYKFPELEIVQCDISKENMVRELVNEIQLKYSELNFLINNAGLMNFWNVQKASTDIAIQKDEILTNIFGTFQLTQSLIPLLLKQKTSVILNVSSALAFVPMSAAPIYNATKAAIHSYSISLRQQLRNTSIKIFEVLPPAIDTEMAANMEKIIGMKSNSPKMSPQKLAQLTVKSLKNNTSEIRPGMAKYALPHSQVFPIIGKKHDSKTVTKNLNKTLIQKNENMLDIKKFGPWAIVTGASSGIGRGFANQLAANGFNLVLVARRFALLEEIGKQLSDKYQIQVKAIEADLSDSEAIGKIIEETSAMEIGLLISNAGTGSVGRFFTFDEAEHKYILQLNAISHLSLTHHFGKLMSKRKRGGILLTGAMGATDGVPYMANAAGTKGYIQSLGKSLHTELKEFGLNVTVLVTTPTETPVFTKLGFTKKNTPIKPITVQQCVSEALAALSKNKITILPGLKFRLMNVMIPGQLSRKMTGKIMRKNNNL